MIHDLRMVPPALTRPLGTLSMDAIDRLEWSVGTVVAGYGVRIGLRTDRADTMEAVLDRLPAALREARPGAVDRLYSVHGGGTRLRGRARSSSLVFSDGQRIARTPRLADALLAFDDDLDRTLAVNTTSHLVLHAGVVGWRGRAIVLPGGSRAGKTTLVRALITAGAEYLAEDLALIDTRLRVDPYPRPLNVRNQGRVLAERLGAWTCRVSLPVGLIVATRYRPQEPSLRRSSPRQALRALLRQVLSSRVEPLRRASLLECLAAQVPCFEMDRGEAEPAAAEILAIFDAVAAQ